MSVVVKTFLDKEKNILFKINGMNDIEEVFNELKKLVSSKELLT